MWSSSNGQRSKVKSRPLRLTGEYHGWNHSVEDIEAWRSSRKLTNLIYALGNQAGFNRDFGLRDQIRRAAVSVMSNIAEGFESRTDVQFVSF
jgi:hypothetical protein